MSERIILKTNKGEYAINPTDQQSIYGKIEVEELGGDNGNYLFYVKAEQVEAVDGALKLLEAMLTNIDVPAEKISSAVSVIEDNLVPPAKVIYPVIPIQS